MNTPGHWFDITRNNDGFATEDTKERMYNRLPVIVCSIVSCADGSSDWCEYEYIDKECWSDFVGDIERSTAYKYYTPVPPNQYEKQ